MPQLLLVGCCKATTALLNLRSCCGCLAASCCTSLCCTLLCCAMHADSSCCWKVEKQPAFSAPWEGGKLAFARRPRSRDSDPILGLSAPSESPGRPSQRLPSGLFLLPLRPAAFLLRWFLLQCPVIRRSSRPPQLVGRLEKALTGDQIAVLCDSLCGC